MELFKRDQIFVYIKVHMIEKSFILMAFVRVITLAGSGRYK